MSFPQPGVSWARAHGAGGRVRSRVARVGGIGGGLGWVAGVFGVRGPGPRLMPQGPGGLAPHRGAAGVGGTGADRAGAGGGRGLRACPICVSGVAREGQPSFTLRGVPGGQNRRVTHWQGWTAASPGPGSPAARLRSRRPRVRCPGVWRGRGFLAWQRDG